MLADLSLGVLADSPQLGVLGRGAGLPDPAIPLGDLTFARASAATYTANDDGDLVIATAATDELRDAHMVLDPVSGLYVPRTLLEMSRTNLIASADLRRFVGWTPAADVTPTITQGQTIPPTATTPGSPAGAATRVQTTGGSTVNKLGLFVLSSQTGAYAGRCLVRNQGVNDVLFGFQRTDGDTTDMVTVAPGQTVLITRARTLADEDWQARFRVTNSAHEIDCVCYGPQIEAGPFATTFTGIGSGSGALSRAVDLASYAIPDEMQPPAIVAAGGAWWYCKFVEGGTGLGLAEQGIFSLGAAGGASLPRLLLAKPAGISSYRIVFVNATPASVFATSPIVTALGDAVELLAQLRDDGAVRLLVRVNGGAAAASGWSAALTVPEEWAGSTMCVNRLHASSHGRNAFLPAGIVDGNGRRQLITYGLGLPGGASATAEEAMAYAAARHANTLPV